MKNFEFPASLFFEKIPKWRGWKDIFYFFFFYILLTCCLYTSGP